jgi:hypothetical protein
MKRPEYNEKLNKVIETCNTHRERMLFALGSLEKILPVDPASMKNLPPDQISLTDQLVYRFSQLQDTIGNKLFPLINEGIGEDIRSKPFIDILNRLEKLSIIDSAEKWLSLREIRNIVTNESPMLLRDTKMHEFYIWLVLLNELFMACRIDRRSINNMGDPWIEKQNIRTMNL